MADIDVIKNCSPTLAGLKTANLFCCPYDSEEDLRLSLRRLNRSLSGKGLRILPLRMRGGKALIYVYRPDYLKRDLENREARSLLSCRGYTCDDQNKCIRLLMKKLSKQEDFPHEIGLFLGYPPEDVRGFIENHACNSKCVGCWKVYGDADAAQRTFNKYKKCTQAYRSFYERGKSLEALAVSV